MLMNLYSQENPNILADIIKNIQLLMQHKRTYLHDKPTLLHNTPTWLGLDLRRGMVKIRGWGVMLVCHVSLGKVCKTAARPFIV